MFDFAWSEIVLIAAVALIAIGPKDMPVAIRTVTSMIKKARRMAGEFQTHVDEMMREADLGDVKQTFRDIRNFDIGGAMERTVDPDRSLRKTFEENPFEPTYPTPAEVSTLDEVAVTAPPVPVAVLTDETAEHPAQEGQASRPDMVAMAKPDAPAYIPPQLIPVQPVQAAATPAEPPAWIPPDAARPPRS